MDPHTLPGIPQDRLWILRQVLLSTARVSELPRILLGLAEAPACTECIRFPFHLTLRMRRVLVTEGADSKGTGVVGTGSMVAPGACWP